MTSDVKAIKAPIRNADIKRAVGAAASEPNGALMVVPPSPTFAHMELIFRLATQYRLGDVSDPRSRRRGVD